MTLIWYQSHHHKSSRAVVNTLVWWPVALTTGWWPVFVVDNSNQCSPGLSILPTHQCVLLIAMTPYWTWSEWEMKTISSQALPPPVEMTRESTKEPRSVSSPRAFSHSHNHQHSLKWNSKAPIEKVPWYLHPLATLGRDGKGRNENIFSRIRETPAPWTLNVLSGSGRNFRLLCFFCGGLWCGTWQKGGCNGQSHDQPII